MTGRRLSGEQSAKDESKMTKMITLDLHSLHMYMQSIKRGIFMTSMKTHISSKHEPSLLPNSLEEKLQIA